MVLNPSQLLRILSRLSTLVFHVEHYALTFHVEHYLVWLTLKSRAPGDEIGSPNVVSRSNYGCPKARRG